MDPQPAERLIRVVFVLLDTTLVLDWAGPSEALRIANRCLVAAGRPERFRIEFAGPSATTQGSVGIQMSGIAPLPQQWDDHPAWIVIPGQTGHTIDVSSDASRAVLHWLRGQRLQSGRLELVTICAGAVVAAHAGHLAGRRATTHHQHLQELRDAEPRCEVVANRIFVADGPLHSSAGVTAGIDLMLARIAQTCDAAIAAQVAQTMVVAVRRGPNDPELSPFLHYRNHMHAALHRVQDAVSLQPQQAWNVPAMAQLAHTSPRHLTRLFLEYAGIGPQQYLRRIRLARAEAALAAGNSVSQAAELAGFSSDTQLRRAWHQFGRAGTPSAPSAPSAPGTPSGQRG